MHQALTPVSMESELRALRAEQQITDALYRFAAGQDQRQPDLFLSAFTEDAELDFTQPAARFGASIPVMSGRASMAGIMKVLEPLDTTHTVTNPRIELRGDRAHLTALVEAQHVSRAQPRRFLLLKNIYEVDLESADDGWQIRAMIIRNVWYDGDPTVLFGPTAEAS